jgi:hypothetical protein
MVSAANASKQGKPLREWGFWILCFMPWVAVLIRSNKKIDAELSIAEKTVETHIRNILAKLGLEDRTQAAVHAVKHGCE